MKIQIACASHSDAILGANLGRSPLLAQLPKEKAEKLQPRLAPLTIQPTAAEAR